MVARALRKLIDNKFIYLFITFLPGLLLVSEVEYIPFVLLLTPIYCIQLFAFTSSPSASLFIMVMKSTTITNTIWIIPALIMYPNLLGILYALTLPVLPIGSFIILNFVYGLFI